MTNLLFTALLVALFAFFLLSKKAAAQVPYDLESPSRTVELPVELREISGLTLTKKPGQLAAVGDEKGQVFFIDSKTGAIEKSPIFREKGDFEDLVMLGDSIWCVKSDGDLYLVDSLDLENPGFEKFTSGFLEHKHDDVEGLCFDEKKHRLVLACKGETDSFNVRRFFAFDLEEKEFRPDPIFTLDPCDVEKLLGKKGKPFSPSGLAIHPKTGEFYVLSSVGKMLAVLSPEGVLKQAVKLDKELLPQPEGICFAADGTLFLSSEGKSGKGLVLVFEMEK